MPYETWRDGFQFPNDDEAKRYLWEQWAKAEKTSTELLSFLTERDNEVTDLKRLLAHYREEYAKDNLPQEPGFYLWYILDLSYLNVGMVQVLSDKEKHRHRLLQSVAEGRGSGFYLYQLPAIPGLNVERWLTMYHQAPDHLPPADPETNRPLVDGYVPFDMRTLFLMPQRKAEPIIPRRVRTEEEVTDERGTQPAAGSATAGHGAGDRTTEPNQDLAGEPAERRVDR